jgi:flagellar basal-body rod modification protein FlgD
MATSVNPVGSLASLLGNQTQNTASAVPQGATESTFLQLLVAQIKNQNPLDPTDSTQFVAQLAQFSELEQVIGIRTDMGALRKDVEQPAAPAKTQA